MHPHTIAEDSTRATAPMATTHKEPGVQGECFGSFWQQRLEQATVPTKPYTCYSHLWGCVHTHAAGRQSPLVPLRCPPSSHQSPAHVSLACSSGTFPAVQVAAQGSTYNTNLAAQIRCDQSACTHLLGLVVVLYCLP